MLFEEKTGVSAEEAKEGKEMEINSLWNGCFFN